ncbi:MAG: GntR family transcriptional regulator [Lachnospiraceae bacterium]|nr:GntR family transcriptional regulator [Lachnospiraceae bacterium]
MKNAIHLEIIAYIKKYIRKNKLAEGDKIPSANTIAAQFNVNRNTVRVALAQLSAQGLIYSEQGKGFFVTGKNKPIVFQHDNGMGFSEILDHGTRNYHSHIIKYTNIKATDTLAALLNINKNDLVHSLKVIREIDDEPFAICHSFLSDKVVPNFEKHLDHFTSVNKILMDDYGFSHPQCARITIEACNASKEDIEYLNLPVQIPILKQNELFVIPEIGPVEYFNVRARGDRFSFKMSFSNELT